MTTVLFVHISYDGMQCLLDQGTGRIFISIRHDYPARDSTDTALDYRGMGIQNNRLKTGIVQNR